MTPPLTCPECGTFVRLDWTDRCESCQAPLLEPVAQTRPKAPTHKGGNLIIVIASVIVLTVIGGGIAFAVSDRDPLTPNTNPLAQTAITTTAADDVTTTTQPMSGSALAQAVEPSSGDVGSAWSQTDERVNAASELTVKSACWPSDAQMSSNIGGSEGDFTYNAASSKGNNLLTFDVTVASNAEVAAHQQAQVASKSYEQCLASADNSLASSLGTVKSRTITHVNRTLPVSYAGYKDSMKMSVNGLSSNMIFETVFLQSGRAREKLRFTYCDCSGGAAGNQEAIIATVAKHLQDNQAH